MLELCLILLVFWRGTRIVQTPVLSMVSSGEQLMLSPILLMRIVALKLVLGLSPCLIWIIEHLLREFFLWHFNSISRVEGGIPPLVELLVFLDAKVQRAAAGPYGLWPLKMMRTKIRFLDFFQITESHLSFPLFSVLYRILILLADSGVQCSVHSYSNASVWRYCNTLWSGQSFSLFLIHAYPIFVVYLGITLSMLHLVSLLD